VLVTLSVVGSVVVCSARDVKHCVGSLLLDSSDAGCEAGGSSSDDSLMCSATCSSSEGRLSPSSSCMSGHMILRYGLLVVLSCSSSCQRPLYKVTALVFFP
jgi:hypothetical protein